MKTAMQQMIEWLDALENQEYYSQTFIRRKATELLLAEEIQIKEAYNNGAIDESLKADETEPNYQNASHYYVEKFQQ